MKTDLDALMQTRQFDALLVLGSGQHNPPMVYLTGGAHFSKAVLVKKRGREAVLFCYAMERDEAAKSGLTIRMINDYPYDQFMRQNNGNAAAATAELYSCMLKDAGVAHGRVAVYGQMDSGQSFAILSALQAAMPDISLIGEMGDSLILAAMATKGKDEIERIRRMGQITTQVVGKTADFLSSQRAKGQILVNQQDEPVTIGDVKRRINLWLAELGADNPHGVIFAQGRDAGVPHSTGDDPSALKLGETIVFDIFPCEPQGGYFYDLTRTWCLGYASDEVLSLYENVYTVYKTIIAELEVGSHCAKYQERACQLFQEMGHATIKETPTTQQGYVHSLGHGVGLNLHELPFFRLTTDANERLDPNVVVTVEPGLYYPERRMGVRLEDTVWIRPDGQKEILAPYPLDLILPLSK
jgi:Xaa-Pro aminopeptidase